MHLGFHSRVCRLTDESPVRLKRLGFRLRAPARDLFLVLVDNLDADLAVQHLTRELMHDKRQTSMDRRKQRQVHRNNDKMLKYLFLCSLACVVCPFGARTCAAGFFSKPFVRPVRFPCVCPSTVSDRPKVEKEQHRGFQRGPPLQH
jgi:hypothetical protein